MAESEPLTTKESKDEKKVREAVSGVIGASYAQVGEVKRVEVDSKFADEFWGSNYSQTIQRKQDKIWRAKVSAVPILVEIVGTTPLGPKEAAKHLNRKFKTQATFYRCQSEFGIKRWDGIAIYPSELLLVEINGTRYVYDILKIQRPTLTAKDDLEEGSLQRLYGMTHTGESVG